MQNTMKTTKNSHIRTCSGYPFNWIPAINARMTVLSNVILGLVPGIHTSSVSLPMDSRNKCGNDITPLMSSSGAHILSSSGLFRGSIMMALTVAFGLAVASPAAADTCPGGKAITGKDGKTYCQSTMSMNWWSAFAWCDAIGMTLVSLDDCNGNGATPVPADGTQCPNFHLGSGNTSWTSSVPNASDAYDVNLSNGNVNGGYGRTNNAYSALCK